MRKSLSGLVALATLSACAPQPEAVTATYVSPSTYSSYNCRAIVAERNRVVQKVDELTGVQKKKASNDAVATGVGMVLFWPALFALGGTKQQEADYARLKGEYDAIQQAMIAKKCEQGTAPASTANAAGAVNAAPVATPANPSTPPEPGR